MKLFSSIILMLAICTAFADLQENDEDSPQVSINVNLRQKRSLDDEDSEDELPLQESDGFLNDSKPFDSLESNSNASEHEEEAFASEPKGISQSQEDNSLGSDESENKDPFQENESEPSKTPESSQVLFESQKDDSSDSQKVMDSQSDVKKEEDASPESKIKDMKPALEQEKSHSSEKSREAQPETEQANVLSLEKSKEAQPETPGDEAAVDPPAKNVMSGPQGKIATMPRKSNDAITVGQVASAPNQQMSKSSEQKIQADQAVPSPIQKDNDVLSDNASPQGDFPVSDKKPSQVPAVSTALEKEKNDVAKPQGDKGLVVESKDSKPQQDNPLENKSTQSGHKDEKDASSDSLPGHQANNDLLNNEEDSSHDKSVINNHQTEELPFEDNTVSKIVNTPTKAAKPQEQKLDDETTKTEKFKDSQLKDDNIELTNDNSDEMPAVEPEDDTDELVKRQTIGKSRKISLMLCLYILQY